MDSILLALILGFSMVIVPVVCVGFINMMFALNIIECEIKNQGFKRIKPTLGQRLRGLKGLLPVLHLIPRSSIAFAYSAFNKEVKVLMVSDMFKVVWDADVSDADKTDPDPFSYGSCLKRVLARLT